MYSGMPELYDTIYEQDREKINQYYHINQVNRLGEYAILSLAKQYKYSILPHYLVRGGKDAFLILDILRDLRTSFFFGRQEFIEMVNLYIEMINVIVVFINSN